MKIKTKKIMNLPQLIEWGWNNPLLSYGKLYKKDDKEFGDYVSFDHQTNEVRVCGKIDCDDTFTIEVEETLTLDTVFPSLAVVRKQHFASGNSTVHVTKINNKSIRSLIGKQPINSTFEYKEVYLMDDDKLGQCIWRDGKLVE